MKSTLTQAQVDELTAWFVTNSDSRLENIAYKNTANTFTAAQTFNAGVIIPAGQTLSLNGKNITLGSSFPGSPADGAVHFHTTYGEFWYWSSSLSKWLSVTEYSMAWSDIRQTQPYSGAAGALAVGAIDRRTGVDIYWTSITMRSQVATTNSAVSFWTTSVQTTGGVGATLATRTTASDGLNATLTQFTVNALADSGNQVAFTNAAKGGSTGLPGPINFAADLKFRKARTS